jgi:uncharacterized protein YkwD
MGRAMLAVVALLFAVPGGAGAATACPGGGTRPNATNAAAAARTTLCLINQIRLAHHLRPLETNAPLESVAASQVRTMVSWDYFADVRPTGQTPMSLIATSPYRVRGADELSVGQNIAWGSGYLSSPGRIVAAWMASPSHRAIILTAEFRDAGVAVKPALPSVLRAGRRGATYAMEFAVRR